ncbi:MAG TPA: hypothetical protein VLN26_13050 [Gaiellaceae bacterium]|nr:hypothetical protein [Gaiellaceae bacterium]
MRLAAAALAALALAAPAAAAPPRSGVLVPGKSLAGVALGAPVNAVLRAWGRSFGICRGCRRPTWYFNFDPFQPQGAGVEFRDARVAAVFTLWSPPGWRTSSGVTIGDPVAEVTAVFGPLDRTDCSGYYALVLPQGRVVTSIYVLDDAVWGFGLSLPGIPPCR